MEVQQSQVSINTIQDAAAVVRRNLLLDRESPDLASQLSISSIYSGVCTGMKDEDYPTTDGLRLPLITDVRRVPLPPELVEQFSHMQCNCIIGVFPEIGRAWLTVDSDIFVWRYVDGDDLAYFDGLAETILSVALIRPKPGVFREHIRYLLVLTTPLDVVILGVSFAEDDINNEMHLLPDPLFTMSSDSTYLLHTVGTSNGRIFTGGKDGCLYEIVYQAKGGWFTRKCFKVNHSRSRLSFLLPSVLNFWLNEEDAISQLCVDDTRNILYTRSEKGTLSVYDLGIEGMDTSCVAHLRLDSIQRRARDIAPGIEPSNLSDIIYIAPITLQESRHVHLVAVTQAGIRLYFLTGQSYGSNPSNVSVDTSSMRPSGINLVHVRLPPGFTGSSVQRPAAVHAAHYNTGTLLLAASNGDDGVLWYIGKDMYAFEQLLREAQTNFALDGRAWVISEVPVPSTQQILAALPPEFGLGIPPNPPVHVTQHIQKPSEYVVISAQGCHIFSKLRPVDQLRHLLETITDPESQTIFAFFRLYKDGEAACCCIILATSCVPSDRHIAERALTVFIHHGGIIKHAFSVSQPEFPTQHPSTYGSTLTGLSSFSPIISGPSRQPTATKSLNGLPVISTPMPGTNPPPVQNLDVPSATSTFLPSSGTHSTDSKTGELTYYSERQQGLYKMFARTVRPIWEGRLVDDYVVSEGGKRKVLVVSCFDVDVISAVMDEINLLKNFMMRHCLTQVQLRDHHYPPLNRNLGRAFGFSRPLSNSQQEAQRKHLADAANAELLSLQYLHELVVLSSEVLGLWRLVLHHQIHVIYEALDAQSRATLKSITFQDFVLSGGQTCSSLISALVNQFIDDNSTVDALIGQLREVCPTVYSPNDAICSKASELLSSARTGSATQRQMYLQESSKLFQQIASTINLPVVLQQFHAARHYTGAVELCISAAQKRDETGLALRLYSLGFDANDPEVDQEFRKAYLARVECYKCITDMLDDLIVIGESEAPSPSVPSQPGPPKPPTVAAETNTLYGALRPEEAQQQADACLQLALRSDDELLHVTVYDWMLKKEMVTQFLRVDSPYIENFLKRLAASHNENPTVLGATGSDLLWQYYERRGRYSSAASILSDLAEKPGSDRDLSKRIEYMSRAKMNASSVTTATADSNAAGGMLLHELEEKLEVSQIQMQALKQLAELQQHDSVLQLNSQLFDVTTLYTEFAEPFQLAECKLAIVHCSGLNDPPLVESLWKSIIDNELERAESSSETTQASMLKNKVIELGSKYCATRRYFPLVYLVTLLEKISCSRGWGTNWVFPCFLECGVTMPDILTVYCKLHIQKLQFWNNFARPFYLLDVINDVLNEFLAEPNKYIPDSAQRRRFVNRSLDVLAVHLVQLRSKATPDQDVSNLIAKFRSTQASFEALQEAQTTSRVSSQFSRPTDVQ